jgi:hypothetical protein
MALAVIQSKRIINNIYCNHIGYLNDLWKYDGNYWTWMSGIDDINQDGHYGELGIPNESNVPTSRYGGVAWTDLSGNLWLFGGVTTGN